MARLFFSYYHRDEALCDRLEVLLAALRREGAIDTWHDRRITAGDDFANKIDENLERADIILLERIAHLETPAGDGPGAIASGNESPDLDR